MAVLFSSASGRWSWQRLDACSAGLGLGIDAEVLAGVGGELLAERFAGRCQALAATTASSAAATAGSNWVPVLAMISAVASLGVMAVR